MGQIQQDLDTYNKERLHINKTGMSVFTAWSLANVISGGVGYATSKEGEARYFHQMNGLWGVINSAIGGAALIGAIRDKKSYDFKKSIKEQYGMEKTFLLNAGLDAAYIAGGIALIQNARHDFKRSEKYRGWGNSIAMQGAALMVFDIAMFVVHNQHGRKKLSPILNRATFSVNENGIGLQFRL